MKTKLLIFMVLTNTFFGTIVFCLPPSLRTLNNAADMTGKSIDIDNVILDEDGNLTVYYAKYDTILVMSIYRFKIKSDGEIVEYPHIVHSLEGRFDDFKALGDKSGYTHLLIGVFYGQGCDYDEYYILDPSAIDISKVSSNPPGDLTCCNFMSDSIFVATRTGDMLGCWREFEGDYDEKYDKEYLQVFLRFPGDTSTSLFNFPVDYPCCYPTIVEITPENKILIIADDVWRTRYYYFRDRIGAENFASYLINLDDQSITNPDSGNIMAQANFKIPNFARNISIYGPSAIWLNDKLLYYFRKSPCEYYEGNVNDSLCILIFDKNGKSVKASGAESAEIIYKNIDEFTSMEKLIPIMEKTADKKWKHRFGLISFKDFPQIYIDLGEE